MFNAHRFRLKKARHYRGYALQPSLTDRPDILDALVRDGIHVIPDFIDRASVAEIMADLEAPVRDLWQNGTNETGKAFVDRDFGVTRLMQADSLSPLARDLFFNNTMIDGLARAYVSADVTSYQRMIEYRTGPGLMSQADNWHFDDWRHRFKAFLYLVDVDADACPFVCLPGTHRTMDEAWRLRKEVEYDRYGKRGAYGYYMFHEIKTLCAENGWTPQVMTGTAGSLILVDTRILHRGSPSRGKERFHLASYFDVRKPRKG